VWEPDAEQINLQLDTTNSVISGHIQVGIGSIPGAASTLISETLTFPVPFKAGTQPVVTVSFAGLETGFQPSAAGGAGGVSVYARATTPTATTVVIERTSNMSASFNYYYSWIAVGVKA